MDREALIGKVKEYMRRNGYTTINIDRVSSMSDEQLVEYARVDDMEFGDSRLHEVSIEQIDFGPTTRIKIDDELADSILKDGIREDVKVRPTPEGHYEVIEGNRRLAGAKKAGLKTIPCIVEED